MLIDIWPNFFIINCKLSFGALNNNQSISIIFDARRSSPLVNEFYFYADTKCQMKISTQKFVSK